mmetsp:Transcript_104651/g.265638  ORF Transcript_104651/g.265638 Transcript_104651/m.265638 type:complete len:518 (-) Transcript_104651:65-1618(-)
MPITCRSCGAVGDHITVKCPFHRRREAHSSPEAPNAGELDVSILRFNRHPAALHDAILKSEFAQKARAQGIEIQPSWANGAKVFVLLLAASMPADVGLRADHVVVATVDMPHIEEILMSLPYRQRPRVKDSLTLTVETYCVERTFVHRAEPKMFTPRSDYACSMKDKSSGHVNPRVHAWPGCEWASDADDGSSSTAAKSRKNLQEFMEELKYCQKRRDLPGAIQCYSNMLRDDVQPDIRVFSILIDICAKLGACEHAEHWVQQMMQKGVSMSEITFNCMINAYATVGNSAKAAEWLASMVELGMTPSLVTYNCVIRACTISGDVLRATQWFEKVGEMHSHNLFSYAPFLSHFGREGLPQEAEEWFAKAQVAGVECGRSMFGHVITAYANTRDLSGARRWCDKLLAKEGGHLQADEYTQLLMACAPSPKHSCQGDGRAAAEVFREQIREGVPPNHFNVEALAKTLGAVSAERLCKELGVDAAALHQECQAMRDELGRSTWKAWQMDDDGSFRRYRYGD